jgi:hypothetical protein
MPVMCEASWPWFPWVCAAAGAAAIIIAAQAAARASVFMQVIFRSFPDAVRAA